ncbi:MAG: hypothetical protein A2V88_14805 [Elusimicrobia bacterium RBG_16_66_12]|nr:MAG: hypothetical protein A2V88_14805 [Elusimicrobia bacterium RBG_16_66_12]
MNPKSASALVWFSAVMILIGFVALDPGLRFVLFVLAAVSAAMPALAGRERSRIAGMVALVASCLLAADGYPAFASRLKAYRARAGDQARSIASPPLQPRAGQK